MTDHAFGDEIAVTHRLVRRTEYPGSGRKKVWKPTLLTRHESTGTYSQPKVIEEPVDAVIIGVRKLANGDASWGGYDEPIVFTAEERFDAYLVAANLRAAPFYVLPEHIVRRARPDEYEVGQVVEHIGAESSGTGVVISIEPWEGRADPYVVVLWGEDEDGWLTGGWLLSERPPLRVVNRPAPKITALIAAALKKNIDTPK